MSYKNLNVAWLIVVLKVNTVFFKLFTCRGNILCFSKSDKISIKRLLSNNSFNLLSIHSNKLINFKLINQLTLQLKQNVEKKMAPKKVCHWNFVKVNSNASGMKHSHLKKGCTLNAMKIWVSMGFHSVVHLIHLHYLMVTPIAKQQTTISCLTLEIVLGWFLTLINPLTELWHFQKISRVN